jgi:phenylacetate-CoA ligase
VASFEIESLPAADLRPLQTELLRTLLQRLAASDAPYWSEKMAPIGIDPDRVTIDDLAELPFTYKAEFRDTYPYGMLATHLDDVVRVHASSGTSGKPTIVAYSRHDIEVFAEVNARAIACAGGSPRDVVHIAYGYGLFTGGLGLHFGAERLGATTVPASGGNVTFQLGLLSDLGATGLASTPSFAMLLAERASEMGMKGEIQLRWGIHGAEPWSESFRHKLEEAWGPDYDACDIYGLSEVMGPGVAAECREAKGGMHIFEDHFLPEIVDPETGEGVDDGSPGELVITTITKEAQPVIRYRTGDITRFLPGGCVCGRTSRRISRIEGRVDDMLIIRGINVYPRQIETLLLADEGVGPAYAIIVDRRETLPELIARVELADPSGEVTKVELARRLEERLAEQTRIRVVVDVWDAGTIPRPEVGKAKRVFFQDSEADPVV